MRVAVRLSFLLFITFAAAGSLQSQNYRFKTYGIEEGLPQSYVYDMVRGPLGYLWICTGEGLSRFDGIYFTTYTIEDSLAENFVTTGYMDSKGNLWFGHNQGGITYFDGKKFRVIRPESPVSSSIREITEDASGNIWLIAQNEGLVTIGKDFRAVVMKTDITTIYYSLSVLNGNLMLVGTSDGLFRVSPSSDEKASLRLMQVEEAPYTRINCISKSAVNNSCYLGTEDEGCCRIVFNHSGKVIEFEGNIASELNLGNENIEDVFIENNSTIWLATNGHGIFKLTSENSENKFRLINYHKKNGLSCDHVKKIVSDHEGNIWAATYGGGFVFLNNDYFVYDDFTDISENKNITSLFYRDQIRWYSTEKGLIRMMGEDRQTVAVYTSRHGLPAARVTSVYQDVKGDVWVGTEKAGLFLKKSGSETFSRFMLSEDVLQNAVNFITGNSDRVWVATMGGIFSINCQTKEKQYYGNREGLPNTNVKHILIDSKLQVWAVCYGKDVCRIGNGAVRKYRISSDNDIMDIVSVAEDSKGNIWLATYGSGVFRFADSASVNITAEQGLFSDYCYSLISDAYGYLWVGHRSGLSRVNSMDYSVITFSKNDGITNEFNYNAAFKDQRGSLWFGSTQGIIKYDPEKNKTNFIPPQLNITSVRFSDKEVDFGQDIEYPYDVYKLRIEFIGISYKDPRRVMYQYKLEGYDLGWSDLSTARFVQYNRIEDGDYTLLIRACNSDGICTEKPLELKIHILAPYWKTWWFYTLFVLLLVLAVYFFFRIRLKRIQYQKRILERQVKERTRELIEKNREIEVKNIELEKLSIVASGTDNSVIIASADGEVEWVNDGFTRMLGFTLQEFKEKFGSNLVQSSSNKDFKEMLRSCIEDRKSYSYSVQNETKSGKKIWVRTTLSPIVSSDNTIKNVVAIDADITPIEEEKERVEVAKRIIEKKNKNITDSINYAKLIQQAILPTRSGVEDVFLDSFILYRPKDIVSGDFYWMSKTEDKIFFAVADCTGHGVPGAFMSMLGAAFLSEIVDKAFISSAPDILKRLRKEIIRVLKQNIEVHQSRVHSLSLLKDGMDISLIVYDKNFKTIQFSGAYNPLFIIRDYDKQPVQTPHVFDGHQKKLYELKGDKMPIGVHDRMDDFTTHVFSVEEGDRYYLFSDGIVDQFGGPDGKKFKYDRLKTLLLQNSSLPFDQQKNLLEEALVSWMNTLNRKTNENYEQVDDITVVGFSIR